MAFGVIAVNLMGITRPIRRLILVSKLKSSNFSLQKAVQEFGQYAPNLAIVVLFFLQLL